MRKIHISSLLLFLFFISCRNESGNNPNSIDVLEKGPVLFEKYGCNVCHSIEGKTIYGPPLDEIYLKEIKVIRKGKEYTTTADRKYLKRSIIDPDYEEVLEYKSKAMPKAYFSKKDVDILVDYLILLNKKN